ncbi:hypothetical protein, partial [Acidiphilium sp.]
RSLGPEMPTARAPLSDRDLDRLFDGGVHGIRMVRSCSAVAGGDVAGRILAAARLWLPEGKHLRVKGEVIQLERAIGRIKKGPSVLVIESDCSPSVVAQLAKEPKVTRGDVLPIWCTSNNTPLTNEMLVFDAGPWPEAMLRHWLADEGHAPALDDKQTRVAIIDATGGAPARLEAMRDLLSDLAVRPVADRIRDLASWAMERPLPAEALGLTQADIACLRVLDEFEDLDPTLDDVAGECSEATGERLKRLASLGALRQGRTPGAAPILTPLGRLIASRMKE